MATIDQEHDFGGVLHAPIVYEPNEDDLRHIQEIEDFLNETEIPFEKDEHFGIYHLNDRTLQLRYVASRHHGMDNSKRFPHLPKGIEHNYFVDISHWNASHGIRTIWLFDFELEQKNDVVIDGELIKDHHRQKLVCFNSIKTACGKIDRRFYARDTEARMISNAEARPFLEANCFYGYRSANPDGTVGLFLKKDKNGLKAGTLLEILSHGVNFYGQKNKMDRPPIEIIRASTRLGCQVIGGLSKCLKHLLDTHETLVAGGKEVKVDELIFYVDASHNDGRGMYSSAMGFEFVNWQNCGFMNEYLEDVVDIDEETGKRLVGKKGEIFHRKPMFHKQIMKLIGQGRIVSIPNAGTIVCRTTRDEFLSRFKK